MKDIPIIFSGESVRGTFVLTMIVRHASIGHDENRLLQPNLGVFARRYPRRWQLGAPLRISKRWASKPCLCQSDYQAMAVAWVRPEDLSGKDSVSRGCTLCGLGASPAAAEGCGPLAFARADRQSPLLGRRLRHGRLRGQSARKVYHHLSSQAGQSGHRGAAVARAGDHAAPHHVWDYQVCGSGIRTLYTEAYRHAPRTTFCRHHSSPPPRQSQSPRRYGGIHPGSPLSATTVVQDRRMANSRRR